MKTLILAYKNFAAIANISHIGLGVAALNTAKTLKANGRNAEVWPIISSGDLQARLLARSDISHVVVSAPWIPVSEWASLLRNFPTIEFAVNCHSNVGFLQADPRGMELVQQYVDLEQASLNFKMSANSGKGADWIRDMYACPCICLPNLYWLDGSERVDTPLWNGGVLNIGAFGAQRPLKNLMSAAGAAGLIAANLSAQTQLWISSGRAEGGGDGVVRSVRAMMSRSSHLSLREQPWQSWPEFRDTVRKMHLLINVSYTESFNMVTADGIAEGVPSVVSPAIDWVPMYWQAPADHVGYIARVGLHLLRYPVAKKDGLAALKTHNKAGLMEWLSFLGGA